MVASSTDPAGGAATWTAFTLPTGDDLVGVSCASAAFCAAVDGAGDLYTSSDPAAGAGAWAATTLDLDGHLLTGIACPAADECLASADGGEILSSTDPTGGPAGWTTTQADPDFSYSPQGISCPSTSFCVAFDDAGNVLTSTDPTGGASAWDVTKVDSSSDDAGALDGAVTCASTQFCMLVDQAGNALFGTPTPGYVPPTSTPPTSPPSPPPAGPGSAPTTPPASSTTTTTPSSVPARPAAKTRIVTRAQIAALLAGDLVPKGRGASIGVVRSRGDYTMVFGAAEAGVARVAWYARAPVAHAARRTTLAPTLVASGRASVSSTGDAKLVVRLTVAGKRLLSHAKRLALTAKGTFTPTGGAPISETRTFELRA
jgi:hypothetical protein